MKIVIGRDALLDGLQKVFSVVPQKPTLPVLTNFLMRAENGRLSVYGTDMDISINTSIECAVEDPGAVMVNAKRLMEIVRALPASEVTIAVKEERVTVVHDKGDAAIMGMSADDYPELRDSIEGVDIAISGREFVELVEKTAFAVAVERTRIALTGVYWRFTPQDMVMVATDGHRLALFRRTSDDQSADTEGANGEAIIPQKALNQASRIVAGGDELKRVVFGDKSVQFQFGDTLIISKLIEGPYPNFNQVIPGENTKLVTVSTSELEAAVRRVSVLSNAITHQIRLSFGSNTVEISTTNMDIGGEAHETLPVDYDGESIAIGFNASFLLEILKKVETDEVRLELETPTSASLAKPVGIDEQDEILYLIMPLRLND